MKWIVLASIVQCFIVSSSYGEELKTIRPKVGQAPDLSEQAQKNWAKARDIAQRLSAGGDVEKLSPEDKQILEKYYDETKESIWDVMGQGCSWYCGGGPSRVTASSSLKPQKDITYVAQNAHDFSFKTAWVEGVTGYGIGEYLEYHFKPLGPRVSRVIVFNGYLKTAEAWKNNSRAKRIKLYIDGKPHAILELEDTRAEQAFDIEPVRSAVKDKNLVLRFEILAAYPGDKWDDVAITELYFDGLDVHCLAEGTRVSMFDGSSKPIEELRVGDEVVGYDPANRRLGKATVLGLARAVHANLVRLDFGDFQIISTDDHPFYVEDQGWCSLNPKKTGRYQNRGDIGTLRVGDAVGYLGERNRLSWRTLRGIEKVTAVETTHAVTRLSGWQGYFANGLLVGIEE